MRKLFLCLIMIAVFATLSCGGGGGDPTLPPSGDRNLAGLEGSWTMNWSMSGSFSFLGETHPIADSGVSTVVITTNSVRIDGETAVWSYDGKNLTLQENWTDTYWFNDTCGNARETWHTNMRFTVKPGDSYASVTGSATMEGTTDECGAMSGTASMSGNMTK